MPGFYNDSIFWVEVERIKPNPYQPRRSFDEARLNDLAASIRQYGLLQPLIVTRKEFAKDDGGIGTEYELIAGERRLRASKIAGLSQVPVIIRGGEEDDRMKLELAIIENVQREDLNPMDRARAFDRLVREFGFKQSEIAKKIAKSREYVSNTIRLLMMPAGMQQALSDGKISEGHTRPLLMLIDRPQEQETLFREIMLKKLTVREAEGIARRIAFDRVRKREKMYDPDIVDMEKRLTEALGTRVAIETKEVGGKLVIDFFSDDDLRGILSIFNERAQGETPPARPPEKGPTVSFAQAGDNAARAGLDVVLNESSAPQEESEAPIDDIPPAEKKEEDAFDPKHFSI